MFARWPIRNKLLVGITLLALMFLVLAGSSMVGLYSYRETAHTLSARGNEVPAAMRLIAAVSDLRVTLESLRAVDVASADISNSVLEHAITIQQSRADMLRMKARGSFMSALGTANRNLEEYQDLLRDSLTSPALGDRETEKQTAEEFHKGLFEIERQIRESDWVLNEIDLNQMARSLTKLQQLAEQLPDGLAKRLQGFHHEVRGRYRAFIVLTWFSLLGAASVAVLLMVLGYRWLFRPLRVLVKGCRRVAGGDFNHVIQLSTKDEMAELAQGMNDMTARFRAIRDDLDEKVRQRTREVIRNEQLASVGFLAAGVAHEINNPLAAIAMCAESMEARLNSVLAPEHPEHDVLKRYFGMIQTESFRCKEITEKLLDFSRLGHKEKRTTDIRALVASVVEMVGHVGAYRGKTITLHDCAPMLASVNSQEIKQVMLNIITNALESLDAAGHVDISLTQREQAVEIVVADNGCGLSDEVRLHLFEPFFTRRRDGHGTGLGLSISYRIIADHGGTIEVESGGAGKGSQFRVTLPIRNVDKENTHFRQAA